jgi:hypothetical protein
MTTAFVLGNGRSRLEVDLHALRTHGDIFGCNALYREFVPTVLVSTDRPISETIQNLGYANTNRMYTRKPIPGMGALSVPQEYYGFSSGPIAAALAAQQKYSPVYLLGFDMGPLPENRFNNVYADTEFYKKSTARPTYTGNWIRQLLQVSKNFPNTSFVRVMGNNTAEIAELRLASNMAHMSMHEFLTQLNNSKDS